MNTKTAATTPETADLIRRIEKAPLPEFLRLLHRPGPAEAVALETWLGAERYARLRRIVLAEGGSRGRRGGARRNVVVLHGIMGGELSVRDKKDEDVIWVNAMRLALGRLHRLRMRPDGLPETDSFATDMMRKYYAEMLTGLAMDANVQPFWFDWRRDLKTSADRLQQSILQWFGPDAQVELVAHSMGGLVARTWMHHYKARWDKGGSLVMLGTPNHGSFAIPQVITGLHKMVRMLSKLDQTQLRPAFTAILNTFPGSLQMLPSPLIMESMEPLYRASTWEGRGVSQLHLDRALRHHETLAGVVDTSRMIYIAGAGHQTAHDVRDWSALDRLDGYAFTPEGDETVPHRLGFLKSDTASVPVWFSPAKHGDLPNDEDVVAAVRQYFGSGEIAALPRAAVAIRGAARGRAAAEEVRARWEAETEAFEALLPRARSRGTRQAAADGVEAEALLLGGFLGSGGNGPAGRGTSAASGAGPEQQPRTAEQTKAAEKKPVRTVHTKVEIALRLGSIAEVPAKPERGMPAVDFLAAGHYEGMDPQYAELALDVLLSRTLGLVPAKEERPDTSQLFITQSTRRGAFSLRLGEPRILPMPGTGRSLAIAGLGTPGTLGRGELTVMVREFISTLAQLGCRHLATVLTGAGAENMDIATASRVWLETIADMHAAGLPVVPHITFMQNSARRAGEMQQAFDAIFAHHGTVQSVLKFDGCLPAGSALQKAIAAETAQEEKWRRTPQPPAVTPPSFITITRAGGGYEFSAITNSAAVPLRPVKVDPQLVESVARKLAENPDASEIREWGTVLERLLIPRDLRARLFSSSAPVVLTLDATTARIPWEMLRMPAAIPGEETGDAWQPEGDAGRFLGTASGYGVTRQLRTAFAPAADTAHGGARDLKFLIVADPAEDAPLPGAQEEAVAVARIVERFAEVYRQATGGQHKVEIVKLTGPSEATREDVVRLLTMQKFDAMHFAGHCFFDQNDPTESGWIFNEGRNERLTAAELSRLDCVPPFVFSNACESGITPDRTDARFLGMAPAFAEAFFQRGVRNFICTAWPVDDAAALTFATAFYEAFLGLREGMAAVTIREAMLLARRECAADGPGGLATWGAYQHYGNPSYRLPFLRPASAADPTAGKPKPRRRS